MDLCGAGASAQVGRFVLFRSGLSGVVAPDLFEPGGFFGLFLSLSGLLAALAHALGDNPADVFGVHFQIAARDGGAQIPQSGWLNAHRLVERSTLRSPVE